MGKKNQYAWLHSNFVEYRCHHCGWAGDDVQETRSVQQSSVGYGGPAGGGHGGGHGTGFVVMEKKRVTKFYCPDCHRPLPKSQQPKMGKTQGQTEQSMGRLFVAIIIAVVAYASFL